MLVMQLNEYYMKILKCKAKEQGYVLLLMMLIMGSLGLYLSYQLSLQKIKSQSWQVQKTAAEIAYWMDIEYNYIIDNNIAYTTTAGQEARNAIKLPDLINNNYLPLQLRGNLPEFFYELSRTELHNHLKWSAKCNQQRLLLLWQCYGGCQHITNDNA